MLNARFYQENYSRSFPLYETQKCVKIYFTSMLRSSTFLLYEIGQVSKCNRMHNYQYNRITKSIYMNAIIERWIPFQIIARITVFGIESLQGGIRILQLSSSLQKKLRKQRRYTAYKPRCFCKLGEGAIDEKVAGRILFTLFNPAEQRRESGTRPFCDPHSSEERREENGALHRESARAGLRKSSHLNPVSFVICWSSKRKGTVFASRQSQMDLRLLIPRIMETIRFPSSLSLALANAIHVMTVTRRPYNTLSFFTFDDPSPRIVPPFLPVKPL